MRTLYLIHDSRIATQVEFVVEMQSKEVYDRLAEMGVDLVHLDVMRHDVTGLVDKEKVMRKDNPTFLLRAEDSLHKIPTSSVNSDFPEQMQNELSRVAVNRLIWSMRDLSQALKHNNTELDSLTMVYCYDPENYEDAQVAMRMLRHESQHQLLEIRDMEVAKAMRM